METLILNIKSKARRATLFGREYLVANMTLIVPGVLKGSQGPLFYPPEETARNPEAWDHKPITLNHPPQGGSKNPSVLNSTQLGFLLNTRYENNALVSEGWFDIERLIKVDRRILNALLQGKKIELSTGLSVDIRTTNESEYNGKRYSLIASNFRPDHLAILPDAIGACSIADGCGVLNTGVESALNTPVFNFMEYTFELSKEDQVYITNSFPEESTMAKETTVSALIQNCDCFTEEDREMLTNLSDEKVEMLLNSAKEKKQALAIANSAKAGIKSKDGNVTLVYNEKTKEWDVEVKNAEGKGSDESNASESDEDNEGMMKGKKKMANNQEQPVLTKQILINHLKELTPEEWYDAAPEPIQESLREAEAIRNEERDKLVEAIVNNSSDDDKERNQKVAENMSLNALRAWASTLAKKPNNGNPYRRDYSGQAAPAVYNQEPEGFPESVPDTDWSFSFTK